MHDDTLRTDLKKLAVDAAVDLTALLARNAYEIIETDDRAFDFVQERNGHAGARTRKIDVANMNLALDWTATQRARELSPTGRFHIESEEASQAFDPAGEPHHPFMRLDEFDGTTNATATAGSWSIPCLSYAWADKYVLAGAAIALADGHLVRFDDRTRHTPLGRPKEINGVVSLSRLDMFNP